MKLNSNHIMLHKAISSRGIGRSCNDLLPDERALLTKEEWIELSQNFHNWNGSPEDFDATRPVMTDFMVLEFINHLLYKNYDV